MAHEEALQWVGQEFDLRRAQDFEQAILDSASIRKTALFGKIPYATTMAGARAMAQAIATVIRTPGGLTVAPLQSYFAKKTGKQDAA